MIKKQKTISYKVLETPAEVNAWFRTFNEPLVACDFETTGLGFAGLEKITHLSIAWSTSDAVVIIVSSYVIEQIIMNWIITTDSKQIWHNAQFDFKYIENRTGQFPKDYEDTAQLAKSLTNHVVTYKSKVGLKELMGWKYGDWAIAPDSFGLDKMYEEYVLRYAAIDAMATYHLWLDIQLNLGGLDESDYKQRTDIQEATTDKDSGTGCRDDEGETRVVSA